MSIVDNELYPKYLIYLESKNLSKGGFELSKISTSYFNEFVFRYENNPHFQQKIDNQYKTIDREEKIEEIVKDDFELFLEELDLPVEPPPFHEDLFDF